MALDPKSDDKKDDPKPSASTASAPASAPKKTPEPPVADAPPSPTQEEADAIKEGK